MPQWILLFCLMMPSAQAWDHHQYIMQSLGRTTANLNRKYLYNKIPLPSEAQERQTIHDLSRSMQIREAAVPIFTENREGQKEIEIHELLIGTMIDEPDLGMDQNLPDEADPKGDREWM